MKAIELIAWVILIFIVVVFEATLTSIGGLGMMITIIVLSVIGIFVRYRQGRRQLRRVS